MTLSLVDLIVSTAIPVLIIVGLQIAILWKVWRLR